MAFGLILERLGFFFPGGLHLALTFDLCQNLFFALPTPLSLKPTGGSLREDHTASPEAQRGKGASATASGPQRRYDY